MALRPVYVANQPRTPAVTLGSVVASDDQYGVVWQVSRDVLRILPIRRGITPLPLSLASEVALHLPASEVGWSIAYNEMSAWPRDTCHVVGELDERCLLRVLQARKATSLSTTLPPPYNLSAVRHSARFF